MSKFGIKPTYDIHIPYYDLLKIAGFTLLPYGISAVGWRVIAPSKGYTKGKTCRFNKSCFWISLNPKYVTKLEVLSMLPMGYALFLVTSKDTSDVEVKTALGMFGITMICNLYDIYTFTRVNDTTRWIGSSLLTTIASGFTYVAFNEVNRLAGWMMKPFVILMLHQTFEVVVHHFKCKFRRPPSPDPVGEIQ